MKILIYLLLQIIMLAVLYVAGKGFSKTGKIVSMSGIVAIIAYSLNEGLRFGRGVDYNVYWREYTFLQKGWPTDMNIGFYFFEQIFVKLGLSWQFCVFVMSLFFIIGVLFLMKGYKDVAMFSIPIFSLISQSMVENMARWFLAYSVFLVGMSFMMNEKKWPKVNYFVLSLLGCLIHYAFFPVPLIFFIVYQFRIPILHPFIAVPLFFVVGLFFQTELMLNFVDYANLIAGASDKFSGYGDNIEYWLTEGYGGRTRDPFMNKSEILFSCVVLYLSYKILDKSRNRIFAYNIFLFGFLLRPLGNQIELIKRYDDVFFFFLSILFAYVLRVIFVQHKYYVKPIMKWIFLLVFINMGRVYIDAPFRGSSMQYLYIWDSEGKSYDKMMQLWEQENEKASKRISK